MVSPLLCGHAEQAEALLRRRTLAFHYLQLLSAVTASPDAPGYFQFGLLLEGAGQITEARSACEQALRLNPEFGPARKALETVGAGRQ